MGQAEIVSHLHKPIQTIHFHRRLEPCTRCNFHRGDTSFDCRVCVSVQITCDRFWTSYNLYLVPLGRGGGRQ
jgi:hypothetical protein